MAGKWVSDGSPEIVISEDGTVLECKLVEGSGGNVYNGLWKENEEGYKSGTHYWQIHLSQLEDSLFVGFTDLEKFKKGWAAKGLMYGGPGNLSSGGALVTGGYGPALGPSDSTVGLLAVFQDEKLKIYFDLDGKPLGQAFDLPATVLNGIFPVVHFSGKGKATITKSSKIPTDLTRPEPVYEGIEGDWSCKEFQGQPPPTSVTVGIKKEGDQNSYNIYLHVLNSIRFTLRGAEGGAWESSAAMTTLMGGPPELMAFERQMSQLFQNPCKVDVEGSTLVVSSADTTSKWQRYSTAKPPVTENPFY